MTRLERNARAVDALSQFERAYRSGDFPELASRLSADCLCESMWAPSPLRGREAVAGHLLGRGNFNRDGGDLCWLVELTESLNPPPESDTAAGGKKERTAPVLPCEPGKCCLMVKQESGGKSDYALLDPTLDADGLVSRIVLCSPELFRTRAITPFVDLFPSNSGSVDNDDEDEPVAMVHIGEAYFAELYVFFQMAGEEFCEYSDLVIPMEHWKKILSVWDEFVSADDYDAVTEKLCGIDYTRWTVSDRKALDALSFHGKRIWDNRRTNSVMLRDLKEWTEAYQNSCGFIRTRGY